MPRDSLHLATGTSLGSISAEGLWSVSLFKKKDGNSWQSFRRLLDANRPPFKNTDCVQTRTTEMVLNVEYHSRVKDREAQHWQVLNA